MTISHDKFLFIRLNLMLAVREAKAKRDMDDIIGRMESILEVVDEVNFFNRMEEEIFGKKDEPNG
jgi:hypothetical protein